MHILGHAIFGKELIIGGVEDRAPCVEAKRILVQKEI